MLNVGVLVSKRLKMYVQEIPAARTLFERETDLLWRINKSKGGERMSPRNELQTLQAHMEDHATLSDLMGLRAGTPITRRRLDKLSHADGVGVHHYQRDVYDRISLDEQVFLAAVRNRDLPQAGN